MMTFGQRWQLGCGSVPCLPNFRRKPGHPWSAAPHLRWSARTRVSLIWQVMSYHWNPQGSGDGKSWKVSRFLFAGGQMIKGCKSGGCIEVCPNKNNFGPFHPWNSAWLLRLVDETKTDPTLGCATIGSATTPHRCITSWYEYPTQYNFNPFPVFLKILL